MVELEELGKLKEYHKLRDILTKESKATFQQILVAHTSRRYLPGHEHRMMKIWKEGGLNNRW